MTIKDVAEYCGVSISTVSRVINNHPDVSNEVRERVSQAIRDLHYVPNDSARLLVKTDSRTIGVIVRGEGNPFFSELLLAIEKEAEKYSYIISIRQIKPDDDELATGASLARSERLKGLIFLGGRSDYTPKDVRTINTPFICCSYSNQFGSLDEQSYSSVSIDDYKESYKAVRYLIDHGHKTIGIVQNGTDDHSVSQLRYQGYIDALKQAGLDSDSTLVATTDGYSMRSGYEQTRELLLRRPDITALFVIADSLAIAAMKAASDIGKQVPKDCSIIGIDGIRMSQYVIPSLTTMVQPPEKMARLAVQTLVGVIEGSGHHQHHWVNAELQKGGSVARIN
jgi:LacI family transcriptional regulator